MMNYLVRELRLNYVTVATGILKKTNYDVVEFVVNISVQIVRKLMTVDFHKKIRILLFHQQL